MLTFVPMSLATTAWALAACSLSTTACHSKPAVVATSAPAVSPTPLPLASYSEDPKLSERAEPPQSVERPPLGCLPADWTVQQLPPLLEPGKVATPSRPDQLGVAQSAFASECTDAPGGPTRQSPPAVVLAGVEIRLASSEPAGSSQRGWTGDQCAFEVKSVDGSGAATRLGNQEIPPFTTVSAVVRSGSAAFIGVSFNGYSAEFPKGGNRVIAVDLCEGRVVWRSKDSMSNGGLLLLDGYLISPYGFTNERRYVFVLDSRSGQVIQKLPVIENICPSKSWAPNWSPGQRCDAPGQAVGAATGPRVEGGVFLIDTNTGSSAFQFK